MSRWARLPARSLASLISAVSLYHPQLPLVCVRVRTRVLWTGCRLLTRGTWPREATPGGRPGAVHASEGRGTPVFALPPIINALKLFKEIQYNHPFEQGYDNMIFRS